MASTNKFKTKLKPNAHGLTTGFFGCPGCLRPGRRGVTVTSRPGAKSVSGTRKGAKRSRVRVKCSGCGDFKILGTSTGC